MNNEEKKIKEYFKYHLSSREIGLDISERVTVEDRKILMEIGLPNKVLDFDFTLPIILKNTDELVIGYLETREVILNLKSRIIYVKEVSFFIAKNLKNLLYQLYVYDYLWNVMIENNRLGKYRSDKNHFKYAKYLENELLKIDSSLLVKDNSYYWGAKIEDIELGIIG